MAANPQSDPFAAYQHPADDPFAAYQKPATPKPQLLAPAPAGNFLRAAPPASALDQLRGMVANSAIGHALESTLPKVADALNLNGTETRSSPTYAADANQLIAPQYLLPSPHNAVGHVLKGALQGVGQLTSAKNLATGAGIAAGGELAAPFAAAAPVLRGGLAALGAKGVYDDVKRSVQQYGSGDRDGGLESIGTALPNAALTLPSLAQPMQALGEGMQTRGENLINNTVGANRKNFARGASPGEGYFQAGLGPSASMKSIAAKAGDALQRTGSQMGDAVSGAAQNGVVIPFRAGSEPITGNIAKTRAVVGGFGGSQDTSAIDNYAATVQPLLSAAEKAGGFNPADYFDAKKNLAKNVQWGDPTQIGLKSLRQQTVGGMAGALGDAIPEVRPLASQYQNLTQLQDIAQQRSDTGSYPLTRLAKLGGLAATLGGGAAAMHGGAAETIGGALVPLALDSVPVRTTAASGLFYGGKALKTVGGGLDSLFSSGLTARTHPLEEDNVGQVNSRSANDPSQSQLPTPGSAGLYARTNLTPEIIRPDALSRSKIGVGADGRGGTLVRPLGALPAPAYVPPTATPFSFTQSPLAAIPARPPSALQGEVGSRANLIPGSVLRSLASGTPEEQATALRLANLGSLGNVLPGRLLANPNFKPQDKK